MPVQHRLLLNVFVGVLCVVLVLGAVVTITMIRRLKRSVIPPDLTYCLRAHRHVVYLQGEDEEVAGH